MMKRIAEEEDCPEGFARSATSAIRQVIKFKMRETNDAEIVGEFTGSVGDVISGIVQQGRDPKMINVNLGRVEGRIPPQEQVPGEVYKHGDRIKCFVVEVKQGLKGPEIMLSRSHPALPARWPTRAARTPRRPSLATLPAPQAAGQAGPAPTGPGLGQVLPSRPA
jgi:N utilization substance protein A